MTSSNLAHAERATLYFQDPMAKTLEAVVLKMWVAATEMNSFPQVGVKINIVQNDQPSAEWKLESLYWSELRFNWWMISKHFCIAWELPDLSVHDYFSDY